MKIIVKIFQLFRRVYWFLFRPITRGVKAIVVKDGKVLLIKNTYDHLLYFPGGGVKRYEEPKQAIVRELKEETGLIVKRLHLAGEYLNEKEYKKDLIYLFVIDDFTIKQQVSKSSEIETACFYKLNNLPDNVSPATLRHLDFKKDIIDKGNW